MPRAIDHIVLPVTTLTLARSRLTSLGFTVAPDARHPFGTGNCCVFFRNGTYLEPITFVDRNVADEAAANGVTFVTALKRFTERRGEGFAMLALRSNDAEKDAGDLEAAGIAGGPPFRFSRAATMPDGSEQEIGVVLVFAADERSPDATIFLCEKTAAGGFMDELFVSHPNGTEGVAGVTAVAEDTSAFRGLLSSTTGSSELEASRDGLGIKTGAGTVAVVTPAEFASRYGVVPPEPRRGLIFAAIDLHVADLDRAIGYAGPTAARHKGRIVVPPSPGLGAVLAFGNNQDG